MKNKTHYWDIAFFLTLMILVFVTNLLFNFIDSSIKLENELEKMENNSKLWEYSANKILEIHEKTIDRFEDDLWSHCEIDCYRFQLAWGYSDTNYCNNYCKDKYSGE